MAIGAGKKTLPADGRGSLFAVKGSNPFGKMSPMHNISLSILQKQVALMFVGYSLSLSLFWQTSFLSI